MHFPKFVDRVTVIESLVQNLKRHSDIITEMEKRLLVNFLS